MNSYLIRFAVLGALCWCGVHSASAQPDRWQQRVAYQMEVNLDAPKYQFDGSQRLTYFNNSPDDLDRIFYHLYFNAFQPNSTMDVRSRTITDPDPRVKDRIANLSKKEIGYLHVKSLTMNGKPVKYEEVETILEVTLPEPLKAGSSAVFEMVFEGQVPLQIRRSGRDNAEGIAFSMAQWYPKLCEYDYQGWHANPYVGREFYGVWGDFDVTLHLPKEYVVAATGILQNPQACGYGYENPDQPLALPAGDRLRWHFKADNVHDFVWAADPDYRHTTAQVPNGPLLRFFFQENDKTAAWKELPAYAVKLFQYASQHFGNYPYAEYSVIQGGDGGMEYPMATLITGNRPLRSLVGVTVHEAMHSWYQMLLATNESLYAWMDEGFTSYASDIIETHLWNGDPAKTHNGSYSGYLALAKSGLEEPLSTHADHFQHNRAYGAAAYSKGAVFLHQLEYVIGKDALAKGLLAYFNTWKFKHPNVNDFIRIMEKQSGLELDWYKEYWVNTIHTIDYGIKSVDKAGGDTEIVLERVGKIPMPIDVVVTYDDGSSTLYYIPLQIMRGEKPNEHPDTDRVVAPDWAWTHPTYTLTVNKKLKKITNITIDPSNRMADIARGNNVFTISENNK